LMLYVVTLLVLLIFSGNKYMIGVVPVVRSLSAIALLTMPQFINALSVDLNLSLLNPDPDKNGICLSIIVSLPTDSFNGCMPNSNPDPDADTDNDGIPDGEEFNGDSDGDLIPDYLDPDDEGPVPLYGDSDSDGIDDQQECGDSLPCRDTDEDGIYDFLDNDSDNDGLTDDEEADGIAGNGTDGKVLPRDTDGDGIPDYCDQDSDNDGINDVDEIDSPHDPANPKDSDNDGIPDVVDPDDDGGITGGGDSDNDGLTDEQECPSYSSNCPDSDNDGQLDYFDNNSDSDDDGIVDAQEDSNLDKDNNPATSPLDTDGDGIANYLDEDSDNDGKNDSDERDEPFDVNSPRDTDGDGIPDVIDFDDGTVGSNNESSGAGDSDNDGIPDVADPANGAPGENGGDSVVDADECDSWPNCLDSDNDGLADYLDGNSLPADITLNVAEQGSNIKMGVQGVGSIHWIFALLLLFFAMFRRASSVLMVVPILFVSWAASAEWSDEMDLYVGGGIGQSYLDPSVGRGNSSVDDGTQNAWKLTAGWDLNDYLSVEGYYSDLGNVELNPDGEIDYRMIGGDAMFHYWAYGYEREEGSVALYAKVGLNHMTNNGRGVRYDKANTIQLFGGIGAEVYLPSKFSVRFEIESYDTDAALLSLNLIKRFGFNSKKSVKKEFSAMVKALPETSAGKLVPVVLDSDSDGLLDNEDECPDTPKGMTINKSGCSIFIAEVSDLISAVQFESDSSALTASSKIKLNEIADILLSYSAFNIEVQAFTDNLGAVVYNEILSQKRADSVVNYLVKKNIKQSRFVAVGFGEANPTADNNTQSGRAKNRRVEFKLSSTKIDI
jgi:outer membrane protein OmpA-like peptidoglycan-associated protein